MADARQRGGSRGPRQCRDCDAPVALWRNANRQDRWLCVDLSPDDNGTVQKIVSGTPSAPIVYGRFLSNAELGEAVSRGEMLFRLHSKTCSARRPVNPKPEGLFVFPPTQHPQP